MTSERAAGLAECARALAAGEVTSREVVERALARIGATQSTVNAFRVVRTEAALTEAAAADGELAAGVRRPLLGVPVAVKDDMDVAGEPTAFGCRGDFPPVAEDGEAVRRLRAAGAVIVGKTNTCELGQWLFTSYDVILAPTTAAPPPPIGTLAHMNGANTDRAMIAACPYAWPWNVLGWPGVNVPAGFVDGGTSPGRSRDPGERLPVGAQLLGPANSEPLLVSLTAQLEADLRWHELWPPDEATTNTRAA